MKAFELRPISSLDSVTPTQRAGPRPGPGQIRLKMRACALNYRDLSVARGAYGGLPRQGLIPLSDGVGEVIEIGMGVTRVKSGDRVAGCFMQGWIGGDIEAAHYIGDGTYYHSGYRRPKAAVPPKLVTSVGVIDGILESDKTLHAKQRHSATRMLERLRDEHSFTGDYTIVREYVNAVALRSLELFVPLAHQPSHAQGDCGEADGYAAARRSAPSTSVSICRTRAPSSSKPTRRSPPNRFSMDRWLPLPFSRGCRNRP